MMLSVSVMFHSVQRNISVVFIFPERKIIVKRDKIHGVLPNDLQTISQ
jgi:hypothetical protein